MMIFSTAAAENWKKRECRVWDYYR